MSTSVVPSSASLPEANIEGKLQKLLELKNAGLITATDFEKQKSNLLGKFVDAN